MHRFPQKVRRYKDTYGPIRLRRLLDWRRSDKALRAELQSIDGVLREPRAIGRAHGIRTNEFGLPKNSIHVKAQSALATRAEKIGFILSARTMERKQREKVA